MTGESGRGAEVDRPVTTPQGTGSALRSRRLAWLMDDLIRIPGTRVRIGLDPLLGMVPVVGDFGGAAIASLILLDAVRHRVPYSVLLLMGWRVVLDALLGLVPFVGDVADAAHRANRKNYRLLEETVARGRTVDVGYRGYALRAGMLVAAVLLLSLAIAVATMVGLIVWLTRR